MKNFKRLLASLVTVITLLAINPIGASAEWKSDSTGWWYTEGNSYNTGWKLIDGNWYYFYSDGYMAHDTTIEGFYLNSAGTWTISIPTTTSYNNGNSGSSNSLGDTQYIDSNGNGLIKGSKSHIYHTPGSKYYDKTTNVVQWFSTVKEAEAAGYRAPEK